MTLFILIASLVVSFTVAILTSGSIPAMVMFAVVSVFMVFYTTIRYINKPKKQVVTWRG